jgi:hypothetical protein
MGKLEQKRPLSGEKKKSALEETGSFRHFYEMTEAIVRGRRVLERDLVSLLQYVDPSFFFKRSFFDSLFGQLIGPGFFLGRKFLYFKGFQQFLEHSSNVFEGAPLKIIQSFNRLLTFLFASRAKELHIPILYARDLKDPDQIFRRQMRLLDELLKEAPQKESLPEKRVLDLLPTAEESALPQIADSSSRHEIARLDIPFKEHILRWWNSGIEYRPRLLDVVEESKKIPPLLMELEAEGRFMQQHYSDIAKTIEHTLKKLEEDLLTAPASLEELFMILQSCNKTGRWTLQDARLLYNEREALRSQIQAKIDGYIKLTERFKQYKDLNATIKQFIARVEVQKISQQELLQVPQEQLKSFFLRKAHAIEEIEQESKKLFEKLDQERRSFESTLKETVVVLQGRLYEIFSGEVPYMDQKNALQEIQQYLQSRIERVSHDAISGNISLVEFQKEIEKLAYDHDVLLLREENAFRTKRLFDFRRAIWGAIHASRIAEFIGRPSFYPSFVDLMRRVCNPFEFFHGVIHREEFNARMRAGWIEFERLQEWSQRSLVSATDKMTITQELQDLMQPCLQDIEALHLQHFHAHIEMPDINQKSDSLHLYFESIESAFPWASPVSLLAKVPTSKERRDFLENAITQYKKRQELVVLGKSLQALRVHEIDRIDEIFQQFEVWDFADSIINLLKLREKTLQLVQEALLFEGAFVDERAVMHKSKTVLHDQIPADLLWGEGVERRSNKILSLFQEKLERHVTSNHYAFMQCYLQRLYLFLDDMEKELFFERMKTKNGVLHSSIGFSSTPWVPECSLLRQKITSLKISYKLEENLRVLFEEIEQLVSAPIQLQWRQLRADFQLPLINQPTDFFYPGRLVC